MPRLPKYLPEKTRLLVESAIERHQAATEALIAFLDTADGDPDHEHDPADPPAGIGIDDDERDGTGHYGGSEDHEPELGWTADINQDHALRNLRLTAVQNSNHGEVEHDGREPQGDEEPEDEGAEHDGREPPAAPFELVQDGAL